MAFGDLTTLGEVKAWLQTGQNPFPGTDDALLGNLVTAASRFIETWLGRPIAMADWVEVRDGSGGQRMSFANIPVCAVLSLTVDGIDIPPSPAGSAFAAGYVFSPTELVLRGYLFTRRAQNVVVTYTAGYAAAPPELAQACIELVCQRYRERPRTGEVSKALGGGETVTYSQKDMSDDIKTVLSRYQAVAPVSGFVRRLAGTATDPSVVAGAL
ncbi:MAG TPA: hypothetical protein VGG57_02220 [Stellaceae bacterium]|jgi:hypothetical protein